MGNKHTTNGQKDKMNKVERIETNDLISFQAFGENTTVPIEIRKAVFDLVDPLPSLCRSLASLELTAVNTKIQKNVSGKFRITLPVGATVKKFEVLRCEPPSPPRWYPAVAVPKKTAKEVVYKEKEKGRDVAAFSDVASGSNLFEIEVSPMPFGQEVKCRLECMLIGQQLEEFRRLSEKYFSNSETEVIVTPATERVRMEAGTDGVGGAAVGEAFGKTHFVCQVPPLQKANLVMSADEKCGLNNISRIAIVWDSSLSMSKSTNLNETRFERLGELAVKCNEHVGSPVLFELHTFCVGAPVSVGKFSTVDELISAIKAIAYDGGTDITTLPTLFSKLSERQHAADAAETCIDSVILFTDGMDSLGSTPSFEGMPVVPFPVHVVADTDAVNLCCARALASASPQYPGCIFSQHDDSYVPGVLYPRPILQSIKTDQSEDAFLEEFDDGFRCVPDHRLQRLNEPIGPEGLMISGILGDKGKCSVSKIVATVSVAGELHDFTFQLRDGPSPDDSNKQAKKEIVQECACSHYFEAEFLCREIVAHDSSGDETKPLVSKDPARILGYLYSEAVYNAAEAFGFKSGIDLKEVREELSVEYGFCSPESSFLMLYSVDQFLENDVLPPKDHPAYNDERAVAERKKRAQQKDSGNDSGKKSIAAGEIGGLKTDEQKDSVVRLARELDSYFCEPAQAEDVWRHRRAAAEGFCSSEADSGLASRYRLEEECALQGSRLCSASPACGSINLSADSVRRSGGAFFSRSSSSARGATGTRMMMSARRMRSSAAPACMPTPQHAAPMERSMGLECSMERSMDLNLLDSSPRISGFLGGSARADSGRDTDPQRHRSSCSDFSPVAPPKDPKTYATAIEKKLKKDPQGVAWKRAYQHEKEKLKGEVSPSFFLTCARLALKHDQSRDAIRIATNCLDMDIEDVQLLRCTAYFLLSCKCEDGVELALHLLGKVKELQPCEPQSYLDLALATFWKVASCMRCGNVSGLAKSIDTIQELITHVLTHKWADRFAEVEWAALILLHYVADFVKELNQSIHPESKEGTLPEWPTPELMSAFQQKDASTDPLRCSNFDLALMVWLGWDTDHTDIDLHVIEPTKNEVYYSNRHSAIGGRLSRDFTNGYGPEVYILKDRKEGDGRSRLAGTYDVFAKYYASHQDSVLTGTTSALLWTIEKDRVKGGGGVVEFNTVRLDTHKEKTKIKALQLE